MNYILPAVIGFSSKIVQIPLKFILILLFTQVASQNPHSLQAAVAAKACHLLRITGSTSLLIDSKHFVVASKFIGVGPH